MIGLPFHMPMYYCTDSDTSTLSLQSFKSAGLFVGTRCSYYCWNLTSDTSRSLQLILLRPSHIQIVTNLLLHNTLYRGFVSLLLCRACCLFSELTLPLLIFVLSDFGNLVCSSAPAACIGLHCLPCILYHIRMPIKFISKLLCTAKPYL